MKIILLLFIPVIFLAGCTLGDSVATVEHPAKQSPENALTWAVDLDIAGGFAGLRQQLSVTSDGMLVAVDKKLGHRVEQVLKPEQHTELNGLLSRLESVPVPGKRLIMPGHCADCIEYLLQTSINDKHISINLRSGEKISQPYADLISYLSSLLRQMLGRSSNNQ